MADGFGKASEACQALFPLLPLLGLGTAGNSAGSEAMRQAVSSARRDHGISLFDLAQNYGSEADIGWGLRAAGVERVDELGRRIFERTFILAKVDLATRAHEDPVKRMRRQERHACCIMPPHAQQQQPRITIPPPRLTALFRHAQVGSTLKNLDVDVLDAVVVHWPICLDAPTSESEHAYVRRLSWEALESMVDDGVIRHLGVSNWTPELLDDLLEYARIRPVLNEIEVSAPPNPPPNPPLTPP